MIHKMMISYHCDYALEARQIKHPEAFDTPQRELEILQWYILYRDGEEFQQLK